MKTDLEYDPILAEAREQFVRAVTTGDYANTRLVNQQVVATERLVRAINRLVDLFGDRGA